MRAVFVFYRPGTDAHNLPFNPFKGLVVPRPIAWISSLDSAGNLNLAPFSYFNAIVTEPPMIMFVASGGERTNDTGNNVIATGEFVVNIVPEKMFEKMVTTSEPFDPEVDEAREADLEILPSSEVCPPRVAESPINLECRLHQVVELPSADAAHPNRMILGSVVGIHIADELIHDGRVDPERLRPLTRLGYKDYAVVKETVTLDDWIAEQSS